MIHTIAVAPGLSPEELKKQLRKKLMTGGAVVRLRPGLSDAEKLQLFDSFAPVAERHSAAALVLRALAQDPERCAAVSEKLGTVSLPEVQRDMLALKAARSLDVTDNALIGGAEDA